MSFSYTLVHEPTWTLAIRDGPFCTLCSESSLFISPHRIILKTCGTTLNLLGLPRILEIAREHASLHTVYRCFYSRKAFMFPERQLNPHRHWKDEVDFLDGIFQNGAAYTVGKVNGDHWLLYLTGPDDAPDNKLEIPRGLLSQSPMYENGLFHPQIESFGSGLFQDSTIEILMSDLSPESCQPFLSQHRDVHKSPTSHAQLLSSALGISQIFPPHLTTLDAYSFSPCGYSANALIRWDNNVDNYDRGVEPGGQPEREGYYTIHVTPEEGSSYASFECNVPLPTSARSSSPHPPCVPDLQTLVQRVVAIFHPGRLSLTLFISSEDDDSNGHGGTKEGEEDSDNGDTAVEAAQRAFKAALTSVHAIKNVDGQDPGKRYCYRRTDKINYEFGGYDLAFASFEILR